MVVGALDDLEDLAPEPRTGFGFDFNQLTDELAGQGSGVIVASAEAALGQITGPPAAERRSLGGVGGFLRVLG